MYRAIPSHLLLAAHTRNTTVPRPFRGAGWPGPGLARTMTAMPTVEIQLLGRFSVAVAGAPISGDAWRSRRAADVVKLLALAPAHRMHRAGPLHGRTPAGRSVRVLGVRAAGPPAPSLPRRAPRRSTVGSTGRGRPHRRARGARAHAHASRRGGAPGGHSPIRAAPRGTP